jgi:hypothetical protein
MIFIFQENTYTDILRLTVTLPPPSQFFRWRNFIFLFILGKNSTCVLYTAQLGTGRREERKTGKKKKNDCGMAEQSTESQPLTRTAESRSGPW